MNNSRKTVRMDSLSRQNQILKSALELAIKKGLKNITRDELADYTHISRGLIHRYFGGFDNLKDKILAIAIQQEILPILAEHISDRKELFTLDLKQKVFKYLNN